MSSQTSNQDQATTPTPRQVQRITKIMAPKITQKKLIPNQFNSSISQATTFDANTTTYVTQVTATSSNEAPAATATTTSTQSTT
jgi:hypothetical protein